MKQRICACLLLAATCWTAIPATGQQSNNHAEIEQLRADLQRIETRLNELEAAGSATQKPAAIPGITAAMPGMPTSTETPAAVSTSAATAPPVATAPAETGPAAVLQAEETSKDTMDAGMGGETISLPHIPEMKLRGFGDVRFSVANQNLSVINSTTPGTTTVASQGGSNTFGLGLMDIFVTSKISKQFSYLTEIGFEADSMTNGIGVDLERAQLTYMPSDKFSLNIGRSHAMLGYYNTAFHHGTWFQTTIDRPHFFEFEDSGGPLPIHNVGLAAMGKVPNTAKLGLHWLAEVGNGKQTFSLPATVTPANVLADHTGKSTNIGMYATPYKFDGLQMGFNWYQASLVPVVSLLPGYGTPGFAFNNATNYYKQNIFMAHVVYITPKTEFMVEDGEIRDLPRGQTKPLYTSGGYTQYSRLIGQFRPYFRYQWQNPNFNDPNNAWVGRWVGPNAGVRWDINTFIALKAEYSHFDWKNFSVDANGNQILPVLHKTIDMFGTQITYTF